MIRKMEHKEIRDLVEALNIDISEIKLSKDMLKELKYSKKHHWEENCIFCESKEIEGFEFDLSQHYTIPYWHCKKCNKNFIIRNGIGHEIKDIYNDLIKRGVISVNSPEGKKLKKLITN